MKKNNYTHYVIFLPEKHIGIYNSWEIVDPLVKRVHSRYMGFWSKAQAERALTLGPERARAFREQIKELGKDKPGMGLPDDRPKLTW